MKKLYLILAALWTATVAANAQNSNIQNDKQMSNKTLVAYFSASGTTKGIAQQLAKVAGADLHEIKPAKAYTRADLDWHDKQSRSSVEMADKSSRPAITDKLANMADYQTIYVGFPIWWGICPRIINSWIDNNLPQLEGKTMIPFATSGSSGIEDAEAYLKKTYPTLQWKKGRLMNK